MTVVKNDADLTSVMKTNQTIQQYNKTTSLNIKNLTLNTKFNNITGNNHSRAIKFSLEVYDVTEQPSLSPTSSIPNNLDDEVLTKNLECPICNEYMLEAIFICTRGHSLCHKCHSSLDKCPFCRSTFSGTRNYILENIAEKTKVRCCNASEGCIFMGTLKEIKIHEENCMY